MSICVAVTDSPEGHAALAAAAEEADRLDVGLVVVNLTADDLDEEAAGTGVAYEVVVPEGSSRRDEVEQVLEVVEGRPETSLLVVGVRRRSAVGKALLGSIAQRLILEADVPVLSVKTRDA